MTPVSRVLTRVEPNSIGRGSVVVCAVLEDDPHQAICRVRHLRKVDMHLLTKQPLQRSYGLRSFMAEHVHMMQTTDTLACRQYMQEMGHVQHSSIAPR